MSELIPDEAYVSAGRIAKHLSQCALEYVGDDSGHDWHIPSETTHDPNVDRAEFTVRVDPDMEEVQLIGPDGQRYGVDVSVVVYPLPS